MARGQAGAPSLTSLGAAALSHTHAEADVTSLVTDLAGKASVYDTQMPTGAVAETMNRRQGGTHLDASLTVWASGTLFLSAIGLRAGTTVSSISFLSGVTAASGASHCWFSLWSPALARLGVTSDDTSATPWSASTIKTLNLAVAYPVTTTGVYYVGVVVVGTIPTLRGAAPNAQLAALAPILGGTSDASLTDPASAPLTAAAITARTAQAYAYVS